MNDGAASAASAATVATSAFAARRPRRGARAAPSTVVTAVGATMRVTMRAGSATVSGGAMRVIGVIPAAGSGGAMRVSGVIRATGLDGAMRVIGVIGVIGVALPSAIASRASVQPLSSEAARSLSSNRALVRSISCACGRQCARSRSWLSRSRKISALASS